MKTYWIDINSYPTSTRLFLEVPNDTDVGFHPGDEENGEPPVLWIGDIAHQIQFEDNEVEVTEVLDDLGHKTRKLR